MKSWGSCQLVYCRHLMRKVYNWQPSLFQTSDQSSFIIWLTMNNSLYDSLFKIYKNVEIYETLNYSLDDSFFEIYETLISMKYRNLWKVEINETLNSLNDSLFEINEMLKSMKRWNQWNIELLTSWQFVQNQCRPDHSQSSPSSPLSAEKGQGLKIFKWVLLGAKRSANLNTFSFALPPLMIPLCCLNKGCERHVCIIRILLPCSNFESKM